MSCGQVLFVVYRVVSVVYSIVRHDSISVGPCNSLSHLQNSLHSAQSRQMNE